tara:strand:+ start:1923 stop:2177 length:255 start_codon:yes stop_codon:yes gene_type:complete
MKENKLIAEFMDLENLGTLTNPMFEYGESGGCRSVEDLHYHTSWDWLMPVVIKIGEKNLRPYSVLRTIEDTHQAVVKFIKEYNN